MLPIIRVLYSNTICIPAYSHVAFPSSFPLLVIRDIITTSHIQNIIERAIPLHVEAPLGCARRLRCADTRWNGAATGGRVGVFWCGEDNGCKSRCDEEEEMHGWV